LKVGSEGYSEGFVVSVLSGGHRSSQCGGKVASERYSEGFVLSVLSGEHRSSRCGGVLALWRELVGCQSEWSVGCRCRREK
jgi:hypothetical protein